MQAEEKANINLRKNKSIFLASGLPICEGLIVDGIFFITRPRSLLVVLQEWASAHTKRKTIIQRTGELVPFTARPKEVQEHVVQASLYSINGQPPPSGEYRLTEGQELHFIHAWYK